VSATTNEALTITVVVCTRNRSASLLRTLESMGRMNVPANVHWELIVVDNNSTDDTREVVQSFARTLAFPVLYLLEARPGAAQARNCGISQAKGDVIDFTDDDMIVHPDWLAHIVDECAKEPSVDLYFGKTPTMRPEQAKFATKESDTEQIFTFPCHPSDPGSSNNMIAHRSILARVGGFDTTLGPGTPCRSAEDVDFNYRVLRAGGVVRYCPGILAYHDHRRLSPEAVRGQQFDYGVAAGAFYCKHILRGDVFALKYFYWEIRAFLRVLFQGRPARPVFIHLTGMCAGLGIRLGVETKRWLTPPQEAL